jgi:hypothetical protein
MVRWHSAALKSAIALGGFAALLVGSGAGVRWGDLSAILSAVTGLF